MTEESFYLVIVRKEDGVWIVDEDSYHIIEEAGSQGYPVELQIKAVRSLDTRTPETSIENEFPFTDYDLTVIARALEFEASQYDRNSIAASSAHSSKELSGAASRLRELAEHVLKTREWSRKLEVTRLPL